MIPILIAAVALVAQRPTMLIYQETVVEFTDTDPNVLVSKKLGDILERSGKVAPIVWISTDPVIEAAIKGGKLPALPTSAKRPDVFTIARTLEATYVAFVKLNRTGAELKGTIEVFRSRGGRNLWKNDTNMSIMQNGRLDPESGAMSVANTWAIQLNANPFKDLPSRPIFENPEPSDPAVRPATTVQLDRTPLESGRKALSEGKLVAAVALLHDAVDVEPMSVEARSLYIEALRRSGHPFLAADEAARAASLMPNEGVFLVEAAEAWIQGGKSEKAAEIIQAALTANPKNAAALSLMGDLHAGRLDMDRAVDFYTQSYGVKQDPETLYKRAQAHAIAERFEESVADIERANSSGLSREPEVAAKRYRDTVKVIDPVIESLAANLRNLLREAGDPGSATALKPRGAAYLKRVEAFLSYLDRIEPPEANARSHTRRELAVSLLHQSAQGLVRYIEGGPRDAVGDAELLQIEAMREFAVAKQQYQAEVGR
jgi:tetratricopeptide (TPR) repeat protein